MEYNDFIRRKDAYNSFKELRKILNGSIANPKDWKKSFREMFEEVGALAMENNCIAQDVMSYYYKDGVDGILEENYDQYMQWEILAGANGNEFAIEKLQFFLNYAIQEIAESENLDKILAINGINEDNYIYILGNLLCEGLVDELALSPKKLVSGPVKKQEYSLERMRVYRNALDQALPKVLEYLLSE